MLLNISRRASLVLTDVDNISCFFSPYRAVDEDVVDKDQILLQKELEVRTHSCKQGSGLFKNNNGS